MDTQTKTKNQIHSWTWYDPEGILIDGKLELTGVTEEAQPSFEEVTEYLPQAIIAQVGDNEAWEEENLQLANWTCAEYVQDENGLWPLEGNYEFTAELPEGYELTDGVDALVVEVSVAGDQVATTADERTVMNICFSSTDYAKDLKFNGRTFTSYNNAVADLASQNNMQFQWLGDDNFKLILNDTTVYNITIASGNWTIELHGKNELLGNGKGAAGIGLYIHGGSATITAVDESASLTVNGYPTGDNNDGSCGIEIETSLTIEKGIVKATVPVRKNHNGSSGAIYVVGGGTLNIKGGSVTATGDGRFGLVVRGTVNMSDGEFKIIGINKVAADNEPGADFILSGGTLAIISPTGNTGLITKGNLTINGGGMNVNILEIADDSTMTVNRGMLETGGIKIGDNGKLINKGTLIANGSFEGTGTIENTGTISGVGQVPEEAKQTPDKITGYNEEIKTNYGGKEINVGSLANISKPTNAGSLKYSLVGYTGEGVQGEGTITEDGKLTVNKAGIFKIKVITEGTGIYKSSDEPGNDISAYITLTVKKSSDNTAWSVIITPADKTYDGNPVEAATITSAIPGGVNASYKYQLSASNNKDSLDENRWESSCPKITNVSDSNQYVFVKVETDNYEDKVFCSANTTAIKQANLGDAIISLDKDTFSYNNKRQVPVVAATNVAGNELTEDKDYTISYTDGANAALDPIDAGFYKVRLTAVQNGNYMGTAEIAFTIEKCKIKSQMTGSPLVKVYDGTTDITEAQKVSVQLYDNAGVLDFQDIHADKVKWAYRSAEVGEHYIDATIISLAGDKVDNYELVNKTSSLMGTIIPRDFKSMTVSATPLTYNGNEQQPQIDTSVDTGINTASGSNAKFYYSKDGEIFDIEVPSFKNAGTYTVHVKATMDNFNDIKKDVEVVVQKAAAPTVADLSETYSYKETGEKRVKFTGIPDDCGTLGAVTAQIVSDEGKILDGSPAVDGSELVFKLKGSSKEMIGRTAQIVVTVETQNYENIEIPVTVTLKADPSDNDSGNNSGNGNSGNNNSGNNSGNGNSGNNNSGSNSGNGNSGSGNNGGNSSSSSSGSSSDDSDYTDSKTTAPKLSDVRSSNTANSAANNVTKDSKKGC